MNIYLIKIRLASNLILCCTFGLSVIAMKYTIIHNMMITKIKCNIFNDNNGNIKC